MVLALVLSAPVTVNAQDQGLADEQVLAAAEQVPALAPAAGPSGEDPSGYNALEANRVLAAQQGLLRGDLVSMQEEALLAIVAAATSWGETSGYNALEANRVAASGLIVQPSSGITPTIPDEAERLAQFRAIERSLSRDLGVEQPETASCGVVD
jgi:hypothetical protein